MDIQKKKLLDTELSELLAEVPDISDADLAFLDEAGRDLDNDADFVADYLKGLFVEDVLRALAEESLSKNALAGRMGKTRQYLGKVLNQDRRVNFTIDSMANIATSLDRRLYVRVLGRNEVPTIFRVETRPMTFDPMNASGANRDTDRLRALNEEYVEEPALQKCCGDR